MVDHVPLCVFMLLLPQAGGAVDEDALQSLAAVLLLVKRAPEELAASTLPPDVVARERRMLADTAGFVEKVMNAGKVDRKQLDDFAASMAEPSLKNADVAEQLELSTADRLIEGWRQSLPKAEWESLRVVVCDGHMPRRANHLMQYFLNLLNEKREGNKVVFLENQDDENKALDLLATHELDRQIAVSFFHDPERMHRDLLSDGAAHYLQNKQKGR